MSKSIEKTDKNLAVNPTIAKEGLCFYDAISDNFYLSGLTYDTKFKRMPEETAKAVNDGVYAQYTNTTGGCLHFRTNSQKIAIKCTMDNITRFPHMPYTGVCGFDMYEKDRYIRTFVPPFDISDGYESLHDFGTENPEKMRDITINFPLYNDVTKLYIGLCEGSTCTKIYPYKSDKPIVYYGSSITQGGCASRPGMSYQSIISRKLGYRHINLGFSGSARGESEMAEYIAGLDMELFVLDYDHNAPNAAHLKNTHEKFFKIIRQKQPNLPIIMLSQHSKDFMEYEKRRSIIQQTYLNTKQAGDKNVYFIDGLTLFPNNDCTVDGTHPTDYGFAYMAEKIGSVIADILK